MKKLFVILSAAAALLAAASCNKEAAQAPAAPAVEAGSPIRLEVNVLGNGETKATGITSNDEATEAKVNSLQILVFNNGALDGYGSAANAKTCTVSCTSGSRDIYAVVNAPSLAAITSESALLATVSTLANEISNFQMIGKKTETLKYDGTVSIEVNRLAARVVVKAVKNAHTNATLAAAFTLKGVSLTNVAGDVDFGQSSSYAVSHWWNMRGYEASNNLGNFTYDAMDAAVAAGAKNETAHYFYSMPNSNAEVIGIEPGESGFTPRAARVVIYVEIAGSLYKYPIVLPALQSNKSYEINCVNITKNGNLDDGNDDPDDPGNLDEEQPIVGFEQNFEIVVKDWTVVLVGDEGEVTI